MRCFQHFHFKMCFSPQRRAIFREQNFKKCSDTVSFWAFSLPNVLFTTAACNFSTSELQKVLRDRQFLCIFTSKCAFRHSGVQFLISSLSTYLRTRRFNRPTFGLTRHTNHWKNTAFRDFSNIWRGCIFFLLTFALLHLLSADLTTLLCFSTVHIVGSFYLNFLRLWVLQNTVLRSKPLFFSLGLLFCGSWSSMGSSLKHPALPVLSSKFFSICLKVRVNHVSIFFNHPSHDFHSSAFFVRFQGATTRNKTAIKLDFPAPLRPQTPTCRVEFFPSEILSLAIGCHLFWDLSDPSKG